MKKRNAEFSVIKEDFTICRTTNGLILKVKQALIELQHTFNDDYTEPKTKFGTRDVSHVIMDSEIDTSGLEEADPRDVTDDDNTGELEFERLKESTNIYESEKSIITITSRINKIFQTNKKDKGGVPILRFNADHEVAVLSKPDFTKPLE